MKHICLILISLITVIPVFADAPPPVMTRYDEPGPLRIGYGRTVENTDTAWFAVDAGRWPGDADKRYNVITADGQHVKGRAWDTGYFDKKCVENEHGCSPILFDLPSKFWLWGDDISVVIKEWWREPVDSWWGLL